MVPSSEAALREAGLGVTRPRVAVLDVLIGHPRATADRVTEEGRARLGSVSTQAVYDVLAAWVAAGLARRIEPAGSPARFERRTGDNHHHLVCRACAQVADVDGVVEAGPGLTARDDAGYVLDEVEIVFRGPCASCQMETSA